MRKIDKLLSRAVVPPFLIALSILTFVVFVHEFGTLSELLITHNASPTTVAMIAGAILPRMLIFTLPLAYLVGILIGLSGLSSESQVTALRACGVPLRRLLAPVLGLGALIGLATGFLSLVVLPATNDLFLSIKDRISVRQATSQVQPRVFNEDFPNVVFYLDDLSSDHQHWSRVFLVDNSDPKTRRTVLAHEGTWISDPEGTRLQLHLKDGRVYEIDPSDASKDNVSVFASTDIPIDFSQGIQNAAAKTPARQKPDVLPTQTLLRNLKLLTGAERRDHLLELHKRFAMPFSVIPFALLGLTLGITTKKGGRASGFVLSLILVLTFYVLFFNGIRLATVDTVSPFVGAWEANILLLLLGIVLMATIEQRNAMAHQLVGWQLRSRLEPVQRLVRSTLNSPVIRALDSLVQKTTGSAGRAFFPKILDLYVSRGFITYFLWSVIICATLFVVLTLFDLLDDIIRNGISAALVTSYFMYLLPQILMVVVPMAILLAILITFGILEKHSEITALKAGGWSLYRIGAPVFLISGLFCVSMYLLQDYVLPFANSRQDSIRNVIKGRPAQTALRPQRKWMFGESGRIYNYDYFDPGQSLFVQLNVFEINMSTLSITRRIHAARAVVEGPGAWRLEDGWIRDFQSPQRGFDNFSKISMPFPERASYFQKEIFQPKESSKLTYLELSNYINYLRKSGYNATDLQVELYKKISFPLSCLIMAILGVPFSFAAGKKGAFFGITASVAIAMSYWGVFSIFETMGAYGILIPLLAAWAPNMLFGAAGLALLFTIRT
jgi:LPS export ABC transporter permease LptG/LPS export ABC transporter permease LptF